ncbi:MAG TPA: hypothetical protein VF002_07505 [Gaiellaceae bacterium]
MDGEGKRGRLRTFALGGLVGASAVLAAVRRRRPGAGARPPRAGLAAFEDAPCYAELLEQERAERPEGRA